MTGGNGYETYRTTHFEGMDSKRLILMLYDGAIKHIRLTRQGIENKDIRMRGENLSRVISIIAELNACLDSKIRDEGIDFLRGLYAAMLAELPKVSITNDVSILNRSEAYIDGLRDIWINSVMKNGAIRQKADAETAATAQARPGAVYGGQAPALEHKSISIQY